MINLDDYKPRGAMSNEVTVIKKIEKLPPGIKPTLKDGEYYYIKLIGLVLLGAKSGTKNVKDITSVTNSIDIYKSYYSFKTTPYANFVWSYNGWVIGYQALMDITIKKCDGSVILNWMGCANINEAIGLNWEGTMPLQYGDRNYSRIVPNIVQMRRDLGL